VEVRALRFALDAMAARHRLEGARSTSTSRPARPGACAARTVRSPRAPTPARVRRHQLQPTGGTELKVLDLMVHDD
jgi:hydrogenase nickel incorporation protein HypA/HybF